MRAVLPVLLLVQPLLSCSGPDTQTPTRTPLAPDQSWAAVGHVGALTRGVAALSDGRVIAATATGLKASDDRGVTWTAPPSQGLPDGAITGVFALGDDALLAWVHGRGALRSSDGGETWAEISGPPTEPLLQDLLNPRAQVVPRAVAPGPNGVLWMAALGGLFTSDDGGEDWAAVDLAATSGSFNALFTDVAVQGDRIWAVSQRADSMLPSRYQGLLHGTVFASDDGGATWTERGDAVPGTYPTSVALAGEVACVGSMDLGVWCGPTDPTADLPFAAVTGGPSDPIGLRFDGDALLVLSASMGAWRHRDGAWSAHTPAGAMAGWADGVALSVDGEALALEPGPGRPPSLADSGVVSVALSFHVNLYHSSRGDSNDDDGYGQDLRVLRAVLDWLDAHPGVQADWDIENHFSLEGWLAADGPDIIARIQDRVAAGQDDVRIMSWNNGAMASSTREEFDAAVSRAQASGQAAFGRMVPGVQPQGSTFTPDHVGWYRDHDVRWVTLSYSATGSTGPRQDVTLEGRASTNPVTLRDPQTAATLTWVPTYHHADLLDHGGLRGWTKQLRQSTPGDNLLVIHFDGDAESWERFDQELDAVADLVEAGEVEWTTIQGYLDHHDPVQTLDATFDVADGTGDGFQSWAEKDLNHELATTLAQAREFADQADWLADGDLDIDAQLDDALTPRLLTLSTTHFGRAAPTLADDRVASGRALAAEAFDAARAAQEAAKDLWMAEHPVLEGTMVVINPRDASGTALVQAEVRVPQSDWTSEQALAVYDDSGSELVVHVGPPRSSRGDWAVPLTFALDVNADAAHTLTWTHRAEGARPTGGLSPADVPSHPQFGHLGPPRTACDGRDADATESAAPPTMADPRTARAVSGVEWRVPLCDAESTVLVDRSVYAGMPGLVVRVEARMGAPSDPTLAETIALSPLQCDGTAERITWRTFGGAERSRDVRAGVAAWNGQSADGWVALDCTSGARIQVAHRVGLRSSLAFAPFSEQNGKATLAPLGTLWGASPWHDGPRTGGTGLGDWVTSLVGSQFRPAAPDWSGKQVRYQLLVGDDLDPGTLDLFAHPPLVLVGPARE